MVFGKVLCCQGCYPFNEVLQGSHICLPFLTDGSLKTHSSTIFMLILVSLPVFLAKSLRSPDPGSCKLESLLNVMYIVIGYIVIAQHFYDVI